MPPSKFTYDLSSEAPPSVLRVDGIGYGFVWHATGSVNPPTSFKASKLLKRNDSIHKWCSL